MWLNITLNEGFITQYDSHTVKCPLVSRNFANTLKNHIQQNYWFDFIEREWKKLLCCGKVTSLTVQANESGLTNYTYSKECVRFWVTPAGYIGSSVVGFALIVASATIIGALASAGCIAAIMIVSLFFQKNWIPRLITIGVVLVVAVLFILHFVGVDPNAIGTRVCSLFIGVNSSLYSISDIIDDNVTRDVSGSDSVVCASLLGCPNSGKTVGIVWLLISLALFIVAIIIHLFLVSPSSF